MLLSPPPLLPVELMLTLGIAIWHPENQISDLDLLLFYVLKECVNVSAHVEHPPPPTQIVSLICFGGECCMVLV